MRRRFVQNEDGSLREIEVHGRPDFSNTFQAGDIPDMMKDVERRKYDLNRKQKAERIETIRRIVCPQ